MSEKDEIIKAINDKGLQKKFIAKQIGLTPCEFSNMLHGRREYPAEKAKLLRTLGIKRKK